MPVHIFALTNLIALNFVLDFEYFSNLSSYTGVVIALGQFALLDHFATGPSIIVPLSPSTTGNKAKLKTKEPSLDPLVGTA